MHALVLSAGAGTRLRPYTDTRPKPMLPIGGRPIVAYNLAMLAKAGFDEVVMNLHYLPEVVRTELGDGRAWGVRIDYSFERELLGTAGALVPVADRFRDGTFAIVFGDNLNDLDLGDLLHNHRERGALATIALYQRDDVGQSGVAELDRNGRISRFIEKPRPGETASPWINAGVLVAEPALLDSIASDGPTDLGRDLLPMLLQDPRGVFGYRMQGRHWWFDRVEDYERALEDEELAAYVSRASARPPSVSF